MEELRQDVKEIKASVLELVKQGIIHNVLLKEHEKRSTNLETIVLPIKQKVDLWDKLSKFAGAVAIGVLVKWLSGKV